MRPSGAPQDCKTHYQFLGLANYFRKFIPDFSRTAAPLTELTKKTVQFQKGEEKMRALRAAALCLCKRAGRWPTTQPSSAAPSAITPLPTLSRRQARWQEFLSRFHPFEVN